MPRSKKMQEASRKRICAKKALIIYMRANRALWDYGEPDYKNKLLKSQLYADIHASLKEEFDSETLSELNCDSADGVKSLWKNLRSTYTMIKKRLTKPGGDITPKPWMWQELMSFLDEVDANPIIDYRRANPEGEASTQSSNVSELLGSFKQEIRWPEDEQEPGEEDGGQWEDEGQEPEDGRFQGGEELLEGADGAPDEAAMTPSEIMMPTEAKLPRRQAPKRTWQLERPSTSNSLNTHHLLNGFGPQFAARNRRPIAAQPATADDEEVFARYLASKLRQVPKEQRSSVERKLLNIVFDSIEEHQQQQQLQQQQLQQSPEKNEQSCQT